MRALCVLTPVSTPCCGLAGAAGLVFTCLLPAQSTSTLQKFFGHRTSKKLRRFELATSLPSPLYVLFSQLEALEDGHGVCVCGCSPWGQLLVPTKPVLVCGSSPGSLFTHIQGHPVPV